VVALIARELAKENEVTLIAGKGSKVKGVEVIAPIESRYSLPGENRERELWESAGVDAREYEVIDFHTHSRPVITAENVCWSIHDLLPMHPIYHYVLVARSRFHANFLNQRWGMEISYVYNCIDPREYKVVERKKDYLLFLSRITRAKGIFNLLDLARRIDYEFVVAGEDRIEYGIDPFELAEVLAKIPDNVSYLGFVSDEKKKQLLSRAKALVIPYDQDYKEVFGIVLIEALACGTPVFAIDSGAVSELFGNGLTTFGYVARSLDGLESALKGYLSGKFEFDPWVLRDYAERFSPSESAKHYLEIYGAAALSRRGV